MSWSLNRRCFPMKVHGIARALAFLPATTRAPATSPPPRSACTAGHSDARHAAGGFAHPARSHLASPSSCRTTRRKPCALQRHIRDGEHPSQEIDDLGHNFTRRVVIHVRSGRVCSRVEKSPLPSASTGPFAITAHSATTSVRYVRDTCTACLS
jgi:hypothetical protein